MLNSCLPMWREGGRGAGSHSGGLIYFDQAPDDDAINESGFCGAAQWGQGVIIRQMPSMKPPTVGGKVERLFRSVITPAL